MKKAVEKAEHHRYPSYEGMLSYREAVAGWYKRRFSANSIRKRGPLADRIQRGIGHIPLPSSTLAMYARAVSGLSCLSGRNTFCRWRIVPDDPDEDNAFLPDFKAIPESCAQKGKTDVPELSKQSDSCARSQRVLHGAIELAANTISSSAMTQHILKYIMTAKNR